MTAVIWSIWVEPRRPSRAAVPVRGAGGGQGCAVEGVGGVQGEGAVDDFLGFGWSEVGEVLEPGGGGAVAEGVLGAASVDFGDDLADFGFESALVAESDAEAGGQLAGSGAPQVVEGGRGDVCAGHRVKFTRVRTSIRLTFQ